METPSTAEGRKPLIVLVEGAPGHLGMKESLLASDQHETVVIDDVRDALEFLNTTTPDLIVLDAELVCAAGCDLSARIQAMPRLARVPMLLATTLRNGGLHFMGVARAQEASTFGVGAGVEGGAAVQPLPLDEPPHAGQRDVFATGF